MYSSSIVQIVTRRNPISAWAMFERLSTYSRPSPIAATSTGLLKPAPP